MAAPLIVPIEPAILPLVVAAAFMLPAVVAGVIASGVRVVRVRPLVGLTGLGLVALAVASYLNPALLAALRG